MRATASCTSRAAAIATARAGRPAAATASCGAARRVFDKRAQRYYAPKRLELLRGELGGREGICNGARVLAEERLHLSSQNKAENFGNEEKDTNLLLVCSIDSSNKSSCILLLMSKAQKANFAGFWGCRGIGRLALLLTLVLLNFEQEDSTTLLIE